MQSQTNFVIIEEKFNLEVTMQGASYLVGSTKHNQPNTPNTQKSSSPITGVKSSVTEMATNMGVSAIQPKLATSILAKRLCSTSPTELNQIAAKNIAAFYLPPYGILNTNDTTTNPKLWRSPSSDYFSNFMLGHQTHRGQGLYHYVENLSDFYKNFTPNSVLAYQLFPTKEEVLHPDCSHPHCSHSDCSIVTTQTQQDFIDNPLLPSAHRKVLDLALAIFGLKRLGNKVHALAAYETHSPDWAKPENGAQRSLLLQIAKSLTLLENQLVAKNLCCTVGTLLKRHGLSIEAEQFFTLSNANETEPTQTAQPIEKPTSPINLQEVKAEPSSVEETSVISAAPTSEPLTASDINVSSENITLPPYKLKKNNSFTKLIRRKSPSILKYSTKNFDQLHVSEYPKLLKKQQRTLEGCLDENSDFSFLNEDMFAKFNELSLDLVLVSLATRDMNSMIKLKEKVSFLLLTLKKLHKKDFKKGEIIYKNNETLETYEKKINIWHDPKELDLFCQDTFSEFDEMDIKISNFNNALNESDKGEFDCGKNKALLKKVTDSFSQLKSKHQDEYVTAKIAHKNNKILASYSRSLAAWLGHGGLDLFNQNTFNEFNAMDAKIRSFNNALNETDQSEFNCGRGKILLMRVTNSFSQLKSKYEGDFIKAQQKFNNTQQAN